jgi:hypothetical protein
MLRDIEPAPAASPQSATGGAAESDTTLAGLVRQALSELARHSPSYARLFADRAGARLAYHVSAGQVDRVSTDGRAAMQAAYLGMQAALTVEPGLNANAFRARLAIAQR